MQPVFPQQSSIAIDHALPVELLTHRHNGDHHFPQTSQPVGPASLNAMHRARRLTQKQAAALIGATQPDIPKLKGGQLKGFTLDRLFSFLLRMNRNIQIRITKARGKAGKLETVAA